MKFKVWLNENAIHFTTFAKDGTVVVHINGKKYTYITDAYYHDKWKRMIPFSPWRVLNIIKGMVSSGQALLQTNPGEQT